MNKVLNIKNNEDAKNKISDIEIIGDDLWQVLCKASSKDQGWMKSTKAMDITNGCLIQVTTQQVNPDGSYSLAEAITFIPDTKIVKNEDGNKSLA